MTLAFRRRPTPKPNSDPHPRDTDAATPKATEVRLHHLDYNLQPLKVESLAHYIDPVVEDERFRVH